MCICQDSPEQQNQKEMSIFFICICIYIYQSTDIDTPVYCKGLAHVIRKAGKFTNCGMGWYAGDTVELMFQYDLEGSLQENSLLLGEVSLFALFRPSTDRMRPTCIMEGNLLYPNFTDLNVNLTQKH